MKLAELVKTRRNGLGLSLQDVADASSISKAHIWEIEQGKSVDMRLSTAAKLAICLNIQITVLVAAALFNDKAQGVIMAKKKKKPKGHYEYCFFCKEIMLVLRSGQCEQCHCYIVWEE